MQRNVIGNPMEAPARKDPRILIVGILNIVFSVIYLGCFALAIAVVPSLVETSRRVLGNDIVVLESVAGVIVNALIFLGLLFSGILLLRGSVWGRSLTLLSALVAIIFLVFDGCLSLSVLGQFAGNPAAAAGFVFGFGGLLLRVAYPIVAAAVLFPSSRALGLK
ncbi:MAG: hypothetical protein KGJ80_20610 [Chloroflexota bacterium]|nr:hypothetical protein [Chloroflexota bacterium]